MAEKEASDKHTGKITGSCFLKNGLCKVTKCLPQCQIKFLTTSEFTKHSLSVQRNRELYHCITLSITNSSK